MPGLLGPLPAPEEKEFPPLLAKTVLIANYLTEPPPGEGRGTVTALTGLLASGNLFPNA